MHININTDGLATIAQNLHELLPGSAAYTHVMRAAAANMLAKVKQRIHQQGQAGDGSDIGAYSVKPIYISAVTGAGKGLSNATGKTGKSVFGSGKKKGEPHTSQYFAGGYNQFKTTVGLNETGKVNLVLTGELSKRLLVLGEPGTSGYGLGWQDEELTKRAQALELKYGKKIWALTEEEKKEMIEEVSSQAKKIMK